MGLDIVTGLQARIRQRESVAPNLARNIETIPAPVFGWNVKDSLDDMDPRFAIQLDNYFPDGSDLRLRRGNVDHATSITGPVESLHTATIGTNEKLIGFANNSAYDVTGSGNVGAPLASGFTNNQWTGTNAGANQGERALYTNGVDAAQSYDGSTWVAAGLTGPTKPNGITTANKRIWVYEEGTGQAWYSPPEAVTGAMSPFDISSVYPDGGALVSIGNVSIDGGQGPDDYTVFVMKSGAVIVYVGTDPADAANWSLRGVWRAGRPIGNKCLVPFDKDLILITDVGFQSILRFTTGGGVSGVPISDNIRNAVSEASQLFKGNYGWNGVYNSAERHLIFNVPVLAGENSVQFVMNSISGAWCQFSNTGALCHAVREGIRYTGANGKVLRADFGGNDAGVPIFGFVQSAWKYFGPRGRDKHFKQFRPKFRTETSVRVSAGIGVNFVDPVLPPVSSVGRAEGGKWDVAKFDQDLWGGGLINIADWRGAHKKGFNASIAIRTETDNAEIQYLSTDMLYEVASI